MNSEKQSDEIAFSMYEQFKMSVGYIAEKAKQIGRLIIRDDFEEPASQPHPDAEQPLGE